MAEHKEWAVSLIVTSEHSYTVLARTPEEAVSIAEDLYENGDMGTVESYSVDTGDAISGDEYVDAEDFELEEEAFES